MRKSIPFFLCLLMVTACENKLYDTEDGLNREMTLFEDEISVPIGNAGPFILDLALQNKTVGALLGSAISTEEDGTIISKSSDQFFKMSAYEIIAKTKDTSKPFSYPVDDRSFTPSGVANLLQAFGFNAVDQHLKVFVNNPLNTSYSLGGKLHVVCQDTKRYVYVYDQSFPLEEITIPRSRSAVSLLDLELPDSVLFTPSTLELKDWCFNLPADMDKEVRSSGSTEFLFDTQFSCHVAAGKDAEIPLAMFGMSKMSFKFELPIASYKFKEVEASFVLENTFPMQVTLSDVKLMTGKTPKVDENLLVSPGVLVIKGGSTEEPGTTPITLNIKALEGSIPNITGIQVELSIKSAPGYADTRLSVKQGVSVKSASATLRGGITIGGNE